VVSLAVIVTLLIACVVIADVLMDNGLAGFRLDRQSTWKNSFDLASDYPFTGLGLGAFTMAYSSYVFLVHVPHTAHAHNLFLNVWIDQGALGLLSFIALAAAALVARYGERRWRAPALMAIGVLLLHGLVDDAFYGYEGGKAAALMFIPFAMLARRDSGALHSPEAVAHRNTTRKRAAFAAIATVMAIGLVFIALPQTRATWLANLGALQQTRAELSFYLENTAGHIQDSIRVMSTVDLRPALENYRAALALDPNNVIANRRLGQIDLSFSRFDDARQHLLQAYLAAPHQRATRQLLGESHAVAGEVDEAVRLWRTVDTGQQQLATRVWWYKSFTYQEERAEWIERAMADIGRP
jgi:tetratricopeptide (TPR) repeat protein